MRAVRCSAYGPPESLTVEELPDPVPGPGEVVVDVAAAAVNFTDVLLLANGYQVSAPLPFTPGSEFAGRVAALGPGVKGFSPGELVRGVAMTGAFAEKALVPASAVTVLPPTADPVLSAASGVTFATAYSALRSVAAIAPGDWVAVTGAAGGVGSAAVAVTRTLGGRALAIVSTAEKARFCAGLGAEAVLDLSATPDVRERVRSLTAGGADVVLDLVGGDLAETLLRTMRRGGRFVTLGYASGVIPRIPLNLVLLKGVSVLGFEIRTFAEDSPDLAARDADELAVLASRGLAAAVTA